jgi:hypothetical protein
MPLRSHDQGGGEAMAAIVAFSTAGFEERKFSGITRAIDLPPEKVTATAL